MDDLWAFLRDPNNREILAWLGGGIVVVVSGLWAAVKFFQGSGDKKSPSIHVTAPDLAGAWAYYSPEGPTPDKQIGTLTIQQSGSRVQARMTYKNDDNHGERIFTFEGKLTSGQLILLFEDVRGPGYVVGTTVLHLGPDLMSLSGRSLYYQPEKNEVVSKARIFKRL